MLGLGACRPRWEVRRTTLTALAGAALLLGGCGSAFEGDGELVAVPGGQVRLWCAGEGDGPTVVFLSAIGGDHSLVPIAERLTGETRACFYDRPGDGETPPPSQRRTAAADAADLHALVAEAGIATPVVLVAHSYGGLVALIAAAEHPEDIAGAVLVDASHPGAEEAFYAVLSEAQRAYFDGRMANFPYIDWPTSLDEAGRAMPDFPAVPLTVITATTAFTDPCDEQLPCDELQALWLDAQAEYGGLTPEARQVLAETGHYVHEDDPDLVLSEIRALLDRL